MAKRRSTPQVRTRPWMRYASLGLLAATGVALCAVIAARPTLGVPGEHAYGYHPAPRARGLLVLLVASAPLVLAAVIVLARRGKPSRVGTWATVGLMCVGSLALHAVSSTATKAYPGMELAWPFLWTNTEGAYAEMAGHAGRLDRFVANYPHGLDVSPDPRSRHYVPIHHAQVHPPGIILAFAALDRFYSAVPAARLALTRAISASFPSEVEMLDAADVAIDHPAPVAFTVAFAAIFLASAAPVVCHLALRGIWPPRVVMGACLLAALLPGTHLFNPSVDQVYPTLVLILVGLAARAATTRRWPWGAAFGLALYAAVFLHVGLALVAVILGLAGILAWRAWRSEMGLHEFAVAYWPVAAGATLGFLTPAFVLQLWLGYPTFRVILACLRNNRLFNLARKRSYGAWVVVTPFEFALSLGVGLALVCLVGWVREVAAAVRAGALRARNAVLLATVGVLGLLVVLGMNRGETARLWLFVTPLLVVGAADALCREERVAPWLFAALAFCQWLQLVVLRVVLDPNWTSTFFLKYLGGQ